MKFLMLLLLLGAAPSGWARTNGPLWLDELPMSSFSEGTPAVSVKVNGGGEPLSIGGKHFDHGVGVASLSVIPFFLDGAAKAFTASVGPDDRANPEARFTFFVLGDRRILFSSPEMRLGDAPQPVKVDLTGIKRLGLLVRVKEESLSKSYADWADAQIEMIGDRVPQRVPNADEKYLLTPPARQEPKINCPAIFGARPGNPFLFTVAATGNRPMTFTAEGLPKGLSLDSQTGIIRGKVLEPGEFTVKLKAKNALGETTRNLRVRIGDTLALTPPLGWNGWNSWAREIDGKKVLDSAHAMVAMGLRDHGWSYVNIDDAWQGQRGGKWNAIQPKAAFPDFTQMVDTIHDLGLKVGLYSTPWIASYAGYVGGSSDFEDGAYPDSIRTNKRAFRRVGKYTFEANDARQLAEWGIDYLKYDWRLELPSAVRMAEALRKSGRDILYSLSNSAPFAQARDWAGVANLWRTGPDIRDSWPSLYQCLFTLDKWWPYGGPGHWNDPDMMIVGNVTTGSALHPTRLTPDEQYSQLSLFCLLSAPLLIGCPLEQLDPFTLNLLTNDEVLAIDQDPLGKSARLISDEKGVQTWLKPLEDGSYALGLFATADYGKSPQSFFRWGDEPALNYRVDFARLGLAGKWKVKDTWRQQDRGLFELGYDAEIRHHGVALLRMYPVKTVPPIRGAL